MSESLRQTEALRSVPETEPSSEPWTSSVRLQGSPARERFTLQHSELVWRIAARLGSRLPPSCENEDLLGDGFVGLLQAIDRFDPAKGVSFQVFASVRIRGAMLDGLRSRDIVPRRVRQGQREFQRTIASVEVRIGRTATAEEIAKDLGLDMEQYAHRLMDLQGIRFLSLDAFEDEEDGEGSQRPALVSTGDTPAQVLEDRERLEILAGLIEALPGRERMVLSLYYEEELTMREIGAVLGVTESRICQIHTQATARLGARFREFHRPRRRNGEQA